MKSDPQDPQSVSAQARARRIRQFVEACQAKGIRQARMLDIGGTLEYWSMNHPYIPEGMVAEIDIVNLPPVQAQEVALGPIKMHVYGGNALDRASFRQPPYDIVFSNSVIEHVGNLRAQLEMARHVRALGTYYWVQTPARSFPIEPHFYFPLFPYLPLGVRTALYQNLNLGFMGREPDWLKARMACEETRLLTKRELQAIFDDGRLIDERLYGLLKSRTATNL